MQDFEKLGSFYIGRKYDLAKKKVEDDLILYDSKDLVTHGVCIGMTGSGKTGLCIGILEEAAIDGIPSIVIDPKGDLANLLLTFPDLRAEDFAPWINPDEARNRGLTAEQYAQEQADRWRKGLQAWGEDGQRIQRLKSSADFSLYTPGSQAGFPVSILQSFSVPNAEVMGDAELLREKISNTTTSLLALMGIQATPMQSREHILLSTIFDQEWRAGKNLDLPTLIQLIQNPPFSRIGVLDLESFFPSNDRFQLSISLNNLLAAPGFDVWLQGDPIDPGKLLYTEKGKPRVSIFSIAHLNDSERMFFVSLLLTEILGWVRTQSGTSSLRALLYMDEIFGYFPPVANPPSKEPLLALLKQARAFGLGVLLATQNPVDLDYKGLSNAGTWFIGRLQTERDKSRLLDGLEGAATNWNSKFDRKNLQDILSVLESRVFLMHNVHEDQPEIFQSRWTLSYLAGPLTRKQIKDLMDSQPSPSKETPPGPSTAAQPPQETKRVLSGKERPVLPPEISQFFLPLRKTPTKERLTYRPMLYGSAKIYYVDTASGISLDRESSYLLDLMSDDNSIDWEKATPVDLKDADLDRSPAADALFEELPSIASKPKSFDGWQRSFAEWLYRSQSLQLLRSNALQTFSKPDESERDFRIRIQEAAREQRDKAVEGLRQKYASKIASLDERLRRAKQAVERESEQARQQKVQTAISFGTTILGALFGRKRLSTTTLGRATTAARGVSRTMKESQDIDRAEESVDAVQKELTALQSQAEQEAEAIRSKIDPQTENLETITVRPKKSNISVRTVSLVWAPYIDGQKAW